MDRNVDPDADTLTDDMSLSARRAWIEITCCFVILLAVLVALRKESVDRNNSLESKQIDPSVSLSARRA